MAFQVAGSSGERIAAGRRCRGRGLGRGEVTIRIERPQLEAAAVDVAHPIVGEQDLGARSRHGVFRGAFELCDGCVQPLAQCDVQSGGTDRFCVVEHVDRQQVAAVGDVMDIDFERKRRLAQVAADAVERAQILHNFGRWGRRRAGCRWCRPFPQCRLRGERVIEVDRRRVDLFEPEREWLGRIGHHGGCAHDEGCGEVGLVGPRAAVEQRHALRIQPAQLAVSSQPGRFGNLRVQRVDLRLQLALRLHLVFSRGISDANAREVGERLRQRRGRHQHRKEDRMGKLA